MHEFIIRLEIEKRWKDGIGNEVSSMEFRFEAKMRQLNLVNRLLMFEMD